MIGVKFEIPNTYEPLIGKVFEGIDLSKYKWKVTQDEVHLPGNNTEGFFEKELYTGEELNAYKNRVGYFIFLRLTGYSLEKEELSEVLTYQDFCTSSAQVVLLIVDNLFAVVFFKQQEDGQKILANAARYYIKAEALKYISEYPHAFDF